MLAGVLEGEVAALAEQPDRLGDEDLARRRRGHHPGGLVHRDPAHVVAGQFHLADVGADAKRQIVLTSRRADRHPAPHRRGGGIERREDAVAGRGDAPAPEALDRVVGAVVVQREQVVPRGVTEPGRGARSSRRCR